MDHIAPIVLRYDTLLLVAGGTGITAYISWLMHVIAKAQVAKSGAVAMAIKRLILAWSIRSAKSMSWVERNVEDLGIKIICQFHITGSGVPLSKDRGSEERPVTENKQDAEIHVASDSRIADEMEDSEAAYSNAIKTARILHPQPTGNERSGEWAYW